MHSSSKSISLFHWLLSSTKATNREVPENPLVNPLVNRCYSSLEIIVFNRRSRSKRNSNEDREIVRTLPRSCSIVFNFLRSTSCVIRQQSSPSKQKMNLLATAILGLTLIQFCCKCSRSRLWIDLRSKPSVSFHHPTRSAFEWRLSIQCRKWCSVSVWIHWI